MADGRHNYDDCPCCDGEGDIGDNECKFCEGDGFLTIDTLEYDETMSEGWDNLDYTTYFTYGKTHRRHFRLHTNQVVIEAGPSFFDTPGTPIQYLTIEEYQQRCLPPEVQKSEPIEV